MIHDIETQVAMQILGSLILYDQEKLLLFLFLFIVIYCLSCNAILNAAWIRLGNFFFHSYENQAQQFPSKNLVQEI